MGCGCNKSKSLPETARASDRNEDGTPVLRGAANPGYTWPPKSARTNGPQTQPKTS